MTLKMVILFLLLAMAASTTHARLDLFQKLASKNQAINNREAVEVNTKWDLLPNQAKSDLIPYPECIQICDDCACTRIYPIEKAMCFCIKNPDAKKPASIQSSGQVLEMTKAKSELINPQEECQKNCKVVCACTPIWPPEMATCVCGDPKRLAIRTSAEVVEADTKLDLVATQAKSGLIPYPVCIKICENCACTRIWPIEKAMCFCMDNPDYSKRPEIQNFAEEVELHSKGKSDLIMATGKNSDPIPYPECIKICDHCACTLIWPPELSVCICINNTDANKKKPTIGNSEEVELHSKGKSDLLMVTGENSDPIPYPECIKICDLCACTLIWPPELSVCICINNTDANNKKPAIGNSIVTEKQVELKVKSDLIPYEECKNTCKVCACTLIWPPELSQCLCSVPMIKSSITEAGNGINALPI